MLIDEGFCAFVFGELKKGKGSVLERGRESKGRWGRAYNLNVFRRYCTRSGGSPATTREAAYAPRSLFTILVDQAMHTHFYFESRRFEELTRYPKFRVGLGHPLHMNPVLIFEIPIDRQFVSGGAVRESEGGSPLEYRSQSISIAVMRIRGQRFLTIFADSGSVKDT